MKKTQTFFLTAIVINLIYLAITFIFFYLLESPIMSSENIDYKTFHDAGRLVLEDLPDLYDPSEYLFPYRYFPIAAYFFLPFSLMGIELGFFFFQIFNFFLSFVNMYLIFKIIQLFKNRNKDLNIPYKVYSPREIFSSTENESILHQYAVLLIIAPQFMNIFLGQINTLVTFLILTSVYYFIKGGDRSDLLGGIFLGLGILFRPSLILILLFIIPLTFNRKTKNFFFGLHQTALRFSGTLILLLGSGIFFLIYPEMLTDFIDVNLAGKYTYTLEGGIEINPSFSLTRIVLILLDIIGLNLPNFVVFILILFLICIPVYFYYIQSLNTSNKLIYGYFVGILIILIVYFDTWPHHLVVIMPFLVLFIILNKEFEHINSIKILHYLLGTIILGFWVLFYITYKIFPLNLGGLILLILLYSMLLLYFKNNIYQNW
jgi:hypothetical protein